MDGTLKPCPQCGCDGSQEWPTLGTGLKWWRGVVTCSACKFEVRSERTYHNREHREIKQACIDEARRKWNQWPR